MKEIARQYSLASFFEPERLVKPYRFGTIDSGNDGHSNSFHESLVLCKGLGLNIISGLRVPPRRMTLMQDGYLFFRCVLSGALRITGDDGQLNLLKPHSVIAMDYGSRPVIDEVDETQTISYIDLICAPEIFQAYAGFSLSHWLLASTGRSGRYLGDHRERASLLMIIDEAFSHFLVNLAARSQDPPLLRQLYLRAKVIELIYHIARNTIASELGGGMSPGIARRSHEKGSLQSVRSLLEKRLSEPPSLKELSDITGLNPNKLTAEFKKTFGLSIHQYGLQQRMAYAQCLLETKHYSVADISERVGYSETSSFSRAFRGWFGRPPTES